MKNSPYMPLAEEDLELRKELDLPRKGYFSSFIDDKKILSSALFLLTLFLFALVGPMISPYSYDGINLSILNQSPSFTHWFGTDDLGRDLFTRVCWGARISLFVGFGSAIIDLFIGVIYGSIAAYFGKRTDEIMMRIGDVLYSVPYILMVILLITLFGTGLFSIMLALTLTGWINMSRVVRAQLLEVREREFVKAALLLGASSYRIMRYHLIPNSRGVIITTMMYTVPTAIFTESFLSFLGLGIQAPRASLGVLVAEGLDALQYYPWRLFFPALAISLTIYALNSLGDRLKEHYEPDKGASS